MLPDLILYLVVGFAFLITFRFVSLKKNSSNFEHVLLESLIIGYVYCTLMYMIPISINTYIDNICIISTTIIVAYILGIINRSKYKIIILDFLHIPDTGNEYLWDDLLDNNYSMRACVQYDEKIYTGYVHDIENYNNSPHIVLCLYTVMNNKYKIVEDYSNNTQEVVVLDTSKAQSVRIIYDSQSDVCEDIAKFLPKN